MDLAFVEKLTKDKKSVKYLPVRHDLFNKTVDAKGRKTKDSKETVRAFSAMITKKNQPKKCLVDKGTKLAGEFKNYAKL